MDELKYSIKQFVNIYNSKDKKKFLRVTKELVVYILVLCLLKLPFILCRDVVVDYFNKMNVKSTLGFVFYWLFEILYILFILLMLKTWLIKNFGAKKD